MAKNFWGALSLTGGVDGSLDYINGAVLTDQDGALVITAAGTYSYILDDDLGGAESSPDIITPDANAGTKRWVLVSQSDQDVSVASSPQFAILTLSTGLSLGFGDLVSEQNPDATDAIRLKGTSSDVDVVLGDVTGYFSVWNTADDNAVFYVDNTGATVTAGSLTVGAGTGEVITGSINRAAGSLLLEIAGTPQLSLSATAATFTENIIIGDGKTIGQAAGPLLTFDDTNNFLEITGCKVGFGTTIPLVLNHVVDGEGVVPGLSAGVLAIYQNNAAVSDVSRVVILAGNEGASLIEFGDAQDRDTGQITYDHNVNSMSFRVNTINRIIIASTGDATFTASIENPKFKITSIGGSAIKLTNKTGGVSVAGQLVAPYSATAVDDAVKTATADSDEVIGVIYNTGVADGSEVWVVVSGIADVLMDAGGSARGDRIISSPTAGSADVWNTGGAVATHFLEIGHCLETRGGAGLAKAVLHFN